MASAPANFFPPKQQRKRILIIDAPAIFREGLEAILKQYSDYEVVALAKDGIEGIELCKKLQPDLVLLGMVLPKMNGIETLEEIKKIDPKTKILLLSDYLTENSCKEAMEAGADGYFYKDCDQDELLAAILQVFNKNKYVSQEITGNSEIPGTVTVKRGEDVVLPGDLLTPRERQILKLIAEGFRNKEIAAMLDISPKTVDNHRTNLMNKLDLHSVQDLTRYADRENFLADK